MFRERVLRKMLHSIFGIRLGRRILRLLVTINWRRDGLLRKLKLLAAPMILSRMGMSYDVNCKMQKRRQGRMKANCGNVSTPINPYLHEVSRFRRWKEIFMGI